MGYCITEYNFLNGKTPGGLQLFLDPLDVVEIKIKKSYQVTINDWGYSDDVYLYVNGKNSKNQKLNYGPFDKNSGLSKIFFENSNYLVQLMNDGPNQAYISFGFSSIDPDEMDENSPLAYDNDKKTFIFIIIVMSVILTFFALLPMFCGCKEIRLNF